MRTDRERIAELETQVAEIRAALGVAGALAISAVQSALEQMVDDGELPATTRNEAFGRIRRELSTVRAGSEDVWRGAHRALPRYQTVADRKREKALTKEFQKFEREHDRELLRLRTPKREDDQSPGSPKAEPGPE